MRLALDHSFYITGMRRQHTEAPLLLWNRYFKSPMLCFDLIAVVSSLVLNSVLDTDAFGMLVLLRFYRILRVAEKDVSIDFRHEMEAAVLQGSYTLALSTGPH